MFRAEGSRERILHMTHWKESSGCGVKVRNWRGIGDQLARGMYRALRESAGRPKQLCCHEQGETVCVRGSCRKLK